MVIQSEIQINNTTIPTELVVEEANVKFKGTCEVFKVKVPVYAWDKQTNKRYVASYKEEYRVKDVKYITDPANKLYRVVAVGFKDVTDIKRPTPTTIECLSKNINYGNPIKLLKNEFNKLLIIK